ncbi:MAC/perforin domain-containing protein [Micromonospora sp. BQ11]|uniref:MAC/perforin domain-containing protein n=1 Tax=Micromonospora sp. BQ11 TaxID=3452212 RepID=UPI003F8C68B8
MSAQERNIPFRDGMALGYGVDDLTGGVGSLRAVDFTVATAAEGDDGMGADYDTSLTYTAEQMYNSLGISVSAEGRYGLTSVEGKFSFAEKSRFDSTSTFLVARADVTNAFKRVEQPMPVEDARALVASGRMDVFRKRYGDLFIRGVKSGGEYFAVLAITSKSTENQRELGVALKASFDGVAAGGSVSASLQSTVSELRRVCDVRVSVYQRGGSGEQISYTGDVDAVMARLKTFASSIQENPRAYSVQLAPYDTLIFEDSPNWFDIQLQRDVLDDSLKKRLELLTIRNDLDLVMLHPEYFDSPPDRATLTEWGVAVTETLNRLNRHVSRVIDDLSAAEYFALELPGGLLIPPRLQHSSTQAEIFTHAGYAAEWQGIPGRSQKLTPGWYDDAKGQILVGNDQISGLKVPEGLAVRAYEHGWFQGAFIDFTADAPAVPMEWNDRISSLVVYPVADGPPKVSHVVALDSLWNRQLVLQIGGYPDLGATSLGARTISTLLVPRGLVARLWDAPNFQGNSVEFLADVLTLPPEWDNRAASIEIFEYDDAPNR